MFLYKIIYTEDTDSFEESETSVKTLEEAVKLYLDKKNSEVHFTYFWEIENDKYIVELNPGIKEDLSDTDFYIYTEDEDPIVSMCINLNLNYTFTGFRHTTMKNLWEHKEIPAICAVLRGMHKSFKERVK